MRRALANRKGRNAEEEAPRLPGTAVFFTGRLEQTPPALQLFSEHVGAVHEQVILVSVVTESLPKTGPEERIEMTHLDSGFHRIILRYGFMQVPNVPSDLADGAKHGLELDLDQLHCFIGKIDMLAGQKLHGMALRRDRVFAFMATSTEAATARYQIPSQQRMEIGLPVGI